MPVAGGQLDAAESAPLQIVRRRQGELLDQASASSVERTLGNVQLSRPAMRDAPIAFGLRPGMWRPRPASWIWPSSRQPAPSTASAQRLKPLELAVVVGARTRGLHLVRRAGHRLGHDHRRTALRPVGVVADQLVRHRAAVGHHRRDRRMDDPVAKLPAGQIDRREHRGERCSYLHRYSGFRPAWRATFYPLDTLAIEKLLELLGRHRTSASR